MCNSSDGDVFKRQEPHHVQFAHTHLPPFSSLGADRSGQPKSSAARPRQENLNPPLRIHYWKPRDLSQFICVVQRESFGISNDAPFANLFRPCFSTATPEACHLGGVLAALTSFKAALLPAFWPLLTCQAWLKFSVVWNGQGPVYLTAAPQWTYIFFFPRWFFRSTEPRDAAHSQTLLFLCAPFSFRLCSTRVFFPSSHSVCHCFVYLHSASEKQMHLSSEQLFGNRMPSPGGCLCNS